MSKAREVLEVLRKVNEWLLQFSTSKELKEDLLKKFRESYLSRHDKEVADYVSKNWGKQIIRGIKAIPDDMQLSI